jgi:hypothetical protein
MLDTAATHHEHVLRHRVPWYVDVIAIIVILLASAGLAYVTGGSGDNPLTGEGGGSPMHGARPPGVEEPYLPVDPQSASFKALVLKARASGVEIKPAEVQFYRTPEAEMEMFKYRWHAGDKERIWEAYIDHLDKWVFNEIIRDKAAKEELSFAGFVAMIESSVRSAVDSVVGAAKSVTK